MYVRDHASNEYIIIDDITLAHCVQIFLYIFQYRHAEQWVTINTFSSQTNIVLSLILRISDVAMPIERRTLPIDGELPSAKSEALGSEKRKRWRTCK